jgi:hypothetical protein
MANARRAGSDQAQFVQHLEKASVTIQSWPIWKQTVLGVVGPADNKSAAPAAESASAGNNANAKGDSQVPKDGS